MRIQVETHARYCGLEMPLRLHIGEHIVEVVVNLDQWYGADYRYFKLRGSDGNLYILRFDESRAVWGLTMFKSPRAEALSVSFAEHRPPPWRRAFLIGCGP